MAERRLDLVIRWLEKNPAVARSVANKVADIKSWTVSLGDETAKLTAVTKKEDSALKGLGFRLGWLGFRMASMGRMILKSAVGPLSTMLKTLTNWEKGIESIAVALGLQEAGMGDTGLSAEELRDILAGIPATGMEVETALGGVQASMWAMAQEAAPALIDILGAVQEIVETVGTAFFVSMAEGLASALKAGAEFLKHLEPIMPFLGKMFAALVLLSPVLIGLGTAMFLLTPFLMASSLGLGAMAISAGGLTIALGPLLLAIVAIGVAVTLLTVYWDDLVKAFEGAQKWFGQMTGVQGWGAGAAPGGYVPPGSQEVTVFSDVTIENMSADVDYARVEDSVNQGVGNALRGRSYPGGVI